MKPIHFSWHHHPSLNVDAIPIAKQTSDGPLRQHGRPGRQRRSKNAHREEGDPCSEVYCEEDEEAVGKAFDMALAVRGESEGAKSVADRYCFETLIRIHRASEGEGFTGLKPAGSVDPAIAAADRAVADGNIDPLADKWAMAVRHEIKERFTTSAEPATNCRSIRTGAPTSVI